jgi:glyoxylase-like metal-dependent hydrolase (beta-lactamase superfamily II)
MPPDLPESLAPSSSQTSSQNPLEEKRSAPKPPQAVLNSIFAFPPNRDTLGATAYLIVENEANILIDCPAWNESNQQFLQQQGPVKWLFLTHRGGIGKVQEIQQTLNCEILIQEQEAYLLPGLRVTSFQQAFTLNPHTQVIWTPGHSPGSACLYHSPSGVLFSGRHLLPNLQGEPVPLRTAKTFHWPRQIRSVQLLMDQFTPETLNFICPGANTGFLRGKRTIDQAYQRLAQLNLASYLPAKPLV